MPCWNRQAIKPLPAPKTVFTVGLFKYYRLLKKRYKILLNYVIGPLLCILLALVIYSKLQSHTNRQQIQQLVTRAFDSDNRGYIVALFLLMLLNWAIESVKWKILVSSVQKVSFFTAVKAVLTGVSFSLFVPNGIGEYFGRIVYMEEGNRLRSISVTIVGSISQILVTIVAGFCGLLYLKSHAWRQLLQAQGFSGFWLSGVLYMVALTIVVVVFIYYRLSWLTALVEKIPLVHKYRYFIQTLEIFHWKELTRILLLSGLRYTVFIVQYLLMLHIFNVQVYWLDAACTTSVLFLVLVILPTIPVADLGIRGETGLQLFGVISKNAGGIVFTAAGIWLLNIIIPAIAGTLFIVSIRLFRNR